MSKALTDVLEGATVTQRTPIALDEEGTAVEGEPWGDTPLWTVECEAVNASVDVHAADEAAALEAARPFLEQRTPAGQLNEERARVVANVKTLLTETDKWAARAYEEGVPMRADRVKYRQALRVALATVAGADDPAAVALPDPPPA